MKEEFKNILLGSVGLGFSLVWFFVSSYKFGGFFLGVLFGLGYVLFLAGILDLFKKKKAADQEKTGH